MSLIEKLDGVLAAIDVLKIEAREGGDARAYLRMANSVERACYEHLRDHGPAIRQAMIDARRLDWLGDEGADRQCFIGMDGRWTVQDGFSMWGGGTLREAIDAARATGEGEGHD